MIAAAALKTLAFALPIAVTAPVVAVAADVRGATGSVSVDVVAIFEATCGSGRTHAASLQESFEAQGFTTDWHNDKYGYFTRAGVTANYHIYPGTWTCFVSVQSAAGPDLCEAVSTHGTQGHARLPDGTCIVTIPEHGLTVVVRDICPDSLHGACTWVQATRTADRECYAAEDVDVASLTSSFVNAN
ncbi:MAG: hypothetical protein AAGB07_02265 [Pseudomonadota bacterium]